MYLVLNVQNANNPPPPPPPHPTHLSTTLTLVMGVGPEKFLSNLMNLHLNLYQITAAYNSLSSVLYLWVFDRIEDTLKKRLDLLEKECWCIQC